MRNPRRRRERRPSTSCSTMGCWCCSIAARTPPASSRRKAAPSTCTRTAGLVRDVFRTRNMRNLGAPWGSPIAAIRLRVRRTTRPRRSRSMSTRRSASCSAHNGNLTNSEQLKRDLFREDLRHVNTNSDSEVLLNVLAHELQARQASSRADEFLPRSEAVHRRCRGAYAVVAMIAGYGFLAFAIHSVSARWSFGRARTARGHGVHGCLRERRARCAGFHAAAGCCAGRSDLHR